MTQATMRVHPANMPAKQQAKPQAKQQTPQAKKAGTQPQVHMHEQQQAKPQHHAHADAHQKQQPKRAQANANEPKPAQTPSDVIANAASETKKDRGVYASMKKAFSPYVEHHSHAVLYGILGFIAAALILIVGFWPTVLLALFAAIGVVIGKYRDGDRKTREQMKNVLDRFN